MNIADKLKSRIEENYKTKDKKTIVDRAFVLNIPEGINFFKPYYDKINMIVILPYKAGKNDPKVKAGDETYILEYWMHRNVGINKDSFLCLKKTYGKPCPICEEIDILKTDYEKNKDLINSLKASKRATYNVLDLHSENSDEIKIFDASFSYFEAELLEEVIDPETKEIICFPDASENGYFIKFRAVEETLGQIKYPKYKSFRFEKRKYAIDKEILNNVICLDELLVIPSYEQVKNAFYGINDDNFSNENSYIKDVIEKDQQENSSKIEMRTEQKNRCPYGHKFKENCDSYNECIQCEIWEECSQ